MMVANLNFFITDHGEKVAHELDHQDDWYFKKRKTPNFHMHCDAVIHDLKSFL